MMLADSQAVLSSVFLHGLHGQEEFLDQQAGEQGGAGGFRVRRSGLVDVDVGAFDSTSCLSFERYYSMSTSCIS